MSSPSPLKSYLVDHHAGSVGGLDLARHCHQRNSAGELGAVLQRILLELEDAQKTLESVMKSLGFAPSVPKGALVWASEKLTRLKRNEGVVGYSSLSRLEELEALSLGIAGQHLMWAVLLQAAATTLPELSAFDFAPLLKQTDAQRAALEPFRLASALER